MLPSPEGDVIEHPYKRYIEYRPASPRRSAAWRKDDNPIGARCCILHRRIDYARLVIGTTEYEVSHAATVCFNAIENLNRDRIRINAYFRAEMGDNASLLGR